MITRRSPPKPRGGGNIYIFQIRVRNGALGMRNECVREVGGGGVRVGEGEE